MYVCIYIYTYTYTYIHTYTYTHNIYIYIYIYDIMHTYAGDAFLGLDVPDADAADIFVCLPKGEVRRASLHRYSKLPGERVWEWSFFSLVSIE
jgi:hypothetical protein